MEYTEILVNAFVTSHLDYGNSLPYGLPNNQLHKLQRAQNTAERVICNVSRFDRVTPSLYSPTGSPLSIGYRIQFQMKLFLKHFLKAKPASRYNLKPAVNTLLLKYPTFKSCYLGRPLIYLCGTQTQCVNNFPCDIRNASKLDHF